ncbi:MAG: DegQ family serine endoprotease [Verrucomicrobiales bacterium]
MKETKKPFATRAAALFLGGALIAGATAMTFDNDAQANAGAKVVPVRLEVDETPARHDARMVTSFSSVVKSVAPSVVKISTTMKGKAMDAEGMSPFDNPMFRRFFGDQFGEQHGQAPSRRMPRQHGLGSGVVVTKDGYILTNNHVVENADEVKVSFGNSSEEYTAKVVGTDPKSDIAVLKIENKEKSFPYLKTADSEKLEVGDVVLAVGNPFGIGQTVTMGIVSATGRATLGMEYEDFIQTDAAINPGNSGGALVDAQGRLIGINTAILSRSGGNQGIGFAVPINLAKSVMESIIQHGRVVRGFLGVNIQDVTPALADQFGLEANEGAIVAEVTPGSPAEKAGLKAGDVVVEFNGKTVRDSRNLKLTVAQVAPGVKAPVKVVRDGKEKTFEVTLKEFPQSDLATKGSSSESANPGDLLDGVTVGDLDARAKAQFEIPNKIKGAVVVSVDTESPSYRAGLREGDVIVELNKQRITNADEAVKLSENVKDKSVLLRVWNKSGTRYVVVNQEKVG